MSKKKPAHKKSATPHRPSGKSNSSTWLNDSQRKLALAILCVATFIAFYPSLQCEFTNWDDGTYVTQNHTIWKLDGESIKKIFTEPVSLNYHPLTMLSLAFDYSLGGLDPYYYHLNNVFFHIINVLLVFFFVRELFLGLQKNIRVDADVIALFTASLFAIHPMRVESVTWVAERKDVLYVMFFFLSCIAYLRYLKKQEIKFMIYAFLFFALSCLSKGMGVVLPVVLMLIDWLYGKAATPKEIWKSALNKSVFFVGALFFGVLAFKIQSQGAIAAMETFSLFQRFTFAGYGFVMYLFKMIWPVDLSAFYPYPFTDAQGNIPMIYYASPFIALALGAAAFWFYWRDKENNRVLLFGLAFYFVTVALVLQFISVGSVIMAERYTYLSYTGIFMVGGFYFDRIRATLSANAFRSAQGAWIVACVVLAWLTFDRTKVWTNAGTLWTDAMKQFPFIEIAYENRGVYYKDLYEKTGKMEYLDHMLADYEFVTEKLHSKNEKIWSNLGNLYGLRKEFGKSLHAYSMAIEYNPGNASTYLNRAITYSMMGRLDSALIDFDNSIKMNSEEALAFKNRAYARMQVGRFDESVQDYNRALELFPYDTLSFLNRGIAYFNAKKFNEAIDDFNKYLGMVPNHAQTCFNISLSYKNLGRNQEALQFALRAQQLGHQVTPDYLNSLQ